MSDEMMFFADCPSERQEHCELVNYAGCKCFVLSELVHCLRSFVEPDLFAVATGGNPIVIDRFLERCRAAIAAAEPKVMT